MIKIAKDDEQELIIRVTSWLEKGAGLASLSLIGFLIVRLFLHRKVHDSRPIGFIGAAVTCGLYYLVAYESSVFAFDSRTRLLTWRRKRALSVKRGILPFSRIEQVILQSVIYNKNYYHKYRILLFTDGGDIPLSIAYEHNDILQTIAERIRSRLGFSPEALVMDSAKALIGRGLEIEAIRLLRHKQGISFSEAEDIVAKIKAGKTV